MADPADDERVDQLQDALRKEARANARILDVFRASATAVFLVFQGWVTHGGTNDLDRTLGNTSILLLGGYFVVAFGWLVFAPLGRWVKYATVTVDILFITLLYEILYRQQFPEPVHYPFAPAAILSLAVATAILRYSLWCTLYAGLVSVLAFGQLAARWNFETTPTGQAIIVLILMTAIAALTVERTRRLTQHASEREVARARLLRHVPRAVAATLLDQTERDPMAVGVVDLSVLAVGLHELGALAEVRTPSEVARVLEGFYITVTDVVFAHGGSLEKPTGDGVIALFGAPVPQKDHATRAVAAAMALRGALKALAAASGAGEADFKAGVGVASGEVVVGAMGPRERNEYTAVGATVDTALALERLDAGGVDVLLAERTYRLLDGRIECELLSDARLVGPHKLQRVYRVRGGAATGARVGATQKSV